MLRPSASVIGTLVIASLRLMASAPKKVSTTIGAVFVAYAIWAVIYLASHAALYLLDSTRGLAARNADGDMPGRIDVECGYSAGENTEPYPEPDTNSTY